ncbi:hypothetical protein DBR36_00960 [Microbacterium sp. HMWF026]|uniref:hypothetical protein n=1 Tax=Microbacterium sp. HMWF026 TaxID=2056861 RepID=UPI000D3746BE|nr:hypothetical protein [Microbacterium sp. HMWF026]PTT22947.1 hypothetical protein DBR36_00960 [Microbacterium sp. HMWF026]
MTNSIQDETAGATVISFPRTLNSAVVCGCGCPNDSGSQRLYVLPLGTVLGEGAVRCLTCWEQIEPLPDQIIPRDRL